MLFSKTHYGCLKLEENIKWETGIPWDTAIYKYINLRNGVLTIKKNYVWDGCTGAITFNGTYKASLVHDAFCQLARDGYMPLSYLWRANWEFFLIMKANNFFLRHLYFLGVTLGCYIRVWYSKNFKTLGKIYNRK